jgi:hypothetical protein
MNSVAFIHLPAKHISKELVHITMVHAVQLVLAVLDAAVLAQVVHAHHPIRIGVVG